MDRTWTILALMVLVAIFWFNTEDRGLGIATSGLESLGRDLDVLASELRYRAEKCGTYPSNDDGLAPLWRRTDVFSRLSMAVGTANRGRQARDPLMLSQYGSDWPLSWCLPIAEGIEDVWGYPVGYENRRGLSDEEFSASPLQAVLVPSNTSWFLSPKLDQEQSWWRRVDKDVYVYSLAGRHRWQYLKNATSQRRVITAGLCLLFCLFFGLALRAEPFTQETSRWIRSLNWLLGSILIMSGLAALPLWRTCYSYSLWRRDYDGERAKEYVQYIEAFKARGVLSPETAAKLVRAASQEAYETREAQRRANKNRKND